MLYALYVSVKCEFALIHIAQSLVYKSELERMDQG